MKRSFFKTIACVMAVSSLAYADFSYEAGADFIYWNAAEDGLEYLSYTSGTFLVPGVADDMTLKAPNFSWDPGVKVHVRAFDACSGDVIGLEWTHLDAEAKSHAVGSDSTGPHYIIKRNTIVQFLPEFDIVDSFEADAKWDLEFNTLDLTYGSKFQICSGWVLTPFAGIRGAWIHQKFQNNSTTLNGEAETTRFETVKNDFTGVGLRLGLNWEWEFCRGFSLIGSGSGSLLYGQFDIKDTVTGQSERAVGNYDFTRRRLASNLETFLGVEWRQCISGCHNIALRVGYDFSYWFNQNQMPGQIQPDVTKSSDLSMHGLRVGADYLF